MWKGDWLPKTSLDTKDLEPNGRTQNEERLVETSFKGSGITLTPLEPMRKWRLQYKGDLRNDVSYSNIKNKLNQV